MAAAQRVLIVSEHPYPDHATVRRNVDQLVAAGLHVDIVCLAPGEPAALERVSHPSVRVFALNMKHKRSGAWRYVREYAGFGLWSFATSSRLALRHRYVAVVVDNPPDFAVFGPVLARIRGARLILEMFELTPELTSVRMKVGRTHVLVRATRLIERLATRWADRIITVSRQCEEILVRRGVDPTKISVVPNTLPVPTVAPSTHSATTDPFIITHCSLIERYGVQVAIAALAQLEAWPELTLRVLGKGEYMPRLQELARELGVEDRVIFRGFLPWLDAISEIRQAAVGIVAIIADGYGELLLPTKLLEYADNEVPVACADLPTIRHHFPVDSLGYFEPGDASELAREIDRLLRNPDQARAQARRAKSAMRALAWETLAPRYMAALGLAAAVPLAGATV